MNNLNILIVEDESLVAMELSNSITALGYNVVEFATNAKMAREFMQNEAINLILMDINLRESLDGIDLYKSLRTKTPVIYLTAYKDEDTISKAIITNPLGYLIKPHNEDELKALLKLALYKLQNNSQLRDSGERIDIGKKYFYHCDEEKVYLNDTYVRLTKKELQLLKLLINARGNIVSYQTIENEIWDNEIVGNSSVRTLIYRLRGKLADDLIKSEFNHGLKLEV
ncbi:response regulator [bacterium]|nr:response regulator [bacterium]MBU1990578.1 response regulator [bacterium]